MSNSMPKILFYDIETAPALVRTWGQYDQNVLWTEQDWYILCFAYKWSDENEIHFVSMPDFKGYKPGTDNDKHVVKALHELMDEADIVVAHNGDSFDQKKANGRFSKHGLGPPSPYQSIDTKKIASRSFRLYSNSLNELGRYFGIGSKEKHHGLATWRGAMDGDVASWDEFRRYNLQDVALLERVYYELLPWLGHPGGTAGPNLALFGPEGETICPKCGHDKLIKRGFHRTSVSVFQTWQCKNCKGYSRSRRREPQLDGGVQLR